MTIRILVGDCREILPQFPDDYFHCVVTSPPFWGLRDYGIAPSVWGGDPSCDGHKWETIINKRGAGGERDYGSHDSGVGRGPAPKLSKSAFCQICGAWHGCLGLEPTPELYVEHLVEIFGEVRRVLRDDGTAWVNLGDSYAGNGPVSQQPTDIDVRHARVSWLKKKIQLRVGSVGGLKPKDLCGIPWRVAFALQADGWWLRSDIIWHKPNCMPESVKDRPTKAHEYLFLLSKSKRYYYDQDAVREGLKEATIKREESGYNHAFASQFKGSPTDKRHVDGKQVERVSNPAGRNRRTVWTIPTQPYSGGHFAVFPEKLVEPCIKAGTSERGACPGCGVPWERVVLASGGTIGQSWHDHEHDSTQGVRQKRGDIPTGTFARKGWGTYKRETTGFRPTCACYDHRYRSEFPRARSARKRWQQDMADGWLPRVRKHPGKDEWPVVPCHVLDLFAGAGTTGMVADRLGRDAVLVDIKPEYCEMAHGRIVEDAGPMFAQVMVEEVV